MITVFSRRRDTLLRDPALMVIGGLLLLLAFLLIRVPHFDLTNRAQQTGLDLLFADLLRFQPSDQGASLIAGLLLFQAVCAPAIFVLLPHALEIPPSVLDRQRQLEVNVETLVKYNLGLAGALALLWGPLLKLGTSGGGTMRVEDGLGCLMLSVFQGMLIACWIALWYAPRPARLWQRLGAWLMPMFWTIDLLQFSDLAIGWSLDSLQGWLMVVAAILGALVVKLRIWEQPPMADDAHP